MRMHLLALTAALGVFALPAIAEAASGTATANVNMRSGPSTQFPPIAVVPAGAPVTVHGCLHDRNWCDTSWGPSRGWVSGAYLATYYERRPVRLSHLPPRATVPVVSFHFGSYWDTHYRSRPFYRERNRWERYERDRRRSGRSRNSRHR